MKYLIVFDGNFRLKDKAFIAQKKANVIDLFPLTSNLTVQENIKGLFESHGYDEVNLLDSARIIDGHVGNLQKEIINWSSNLGDIRVNGKKLKKWLVTPGGDVSTWWFSLVSEKNNLKTGIFFKIAQIHAIKHILSSGSYDYCIISINDKDIARAVKEIAIRLKINFKEFSSIAPNTFKAKTKKILERIGLPGQFILGVFTWIKLIRRSQTCKKLLGPIIRRKPEAESVLFVSYFPAIDEEAAGKGIFRNKYALPLQDKLNELGVQVNWLLMYVPIDGYLYNDAVRLAALFARNGSKLFMIDEFLTISDAVKSFFLWLRQIFLSYYLFQFVKKSSQFTSFIGDECKHIMGSLWNSSFSGSVGIQGIIYLYIFKKVFKTFPKVTDCIYYSEMHAWEKALNAAKKNLNIRTIGYQHTSVSSNYFFYFYNMTETARSGEDSDLPLPDVTASNGKLMNSLLAESGYPGLITVEAIRQMYLGKQLSCNILSKNPKPILLVAGSIDKTETLALIALVNAAFPKKKDFDIFFKGHPSMPLEDLFSESNIDLSKTGYVVCHDSISRYLETAWAILVPTSSVAIEALAFGCEVIVPVFPDSMLMNPLAGFEHYYHKITCPDDLKKVMKKVISGFSLASFEEYKEFVNSYWCIDPGLPRWERLLLSKE